MNAAELDALLTEVRRADAIRARERFGFAQSALVERRLDDARAELERALALTTRHKLDDVACAFLESIADAFERGIGDELSARRIRKTL